MQLKNKALAITLTSWFSLLSIILILSHIYLKTEFYHLEQQFTRRGITRVHQFLESNGHNLQSIAESWAHWDTSYQMAKAPQTAPLTPSLTRIKGEKANADKITARPKDPAVVFGDQHLTTTVLQRYGFQGVLMFDNHEHVFFEKTDKLSPHYIQFLKENIPNWLKDHSMSGFIKINDQLFMLAQAQILNSNKQGPPLGHLVVIKRLTTNFIKQLNSITLSPTQINLLSQNHSTSNRYKIVQKLNQTSDNYFEQTDNQDVAAYSLIQDIYHQPIALAKVIMPQDISQQGYRAIYYYSLAIVLLGLLMGLLVTWIIKHHIVGRILKLSQQVIHIGIQRSYDQRVQIEGSDELNEVADNINEMLSTVEAAQEQRVQERTQSLRDLNHQLRQEINIRKKTEQQLVDSEEKLRHLAHHDSLTDLPNRALFDEVLNKAILNAERHQEELAILFVDLDRFKYINDAFGHYLGDEVLKIVGTRFKTALRTTDTIARQGGDEFIILLESFTKKEDIFRVAEKLQHSLQQPMNIQHREFVINASIGVSIYPDDGKTMEELTRKADMAMYRAKCAGGNGIHFYTEQMNVEAHERMMLEETLRHALVNHEFINYYQPKLCLRTGQIIGVEALLRHRKTDNSIVPAGSFIRLAEETGLINQISTYVLNQACKDTQIWHQQGFKDLTTAINVSAVEFRNNDFVPQLLQTVNKYGIDHSKIQVELTESALIYDIHGAREKLAELHNAGLKIIVDDFETGYSSLNYLKEFPVDGLKIDKSFVDGIPHDRWDVAIIKAIITLAHNLDLAITAEGVANQQQLSFLNVLGCDAIQGFFISEAIAAENIYEFLRQHQTNR